MNLLCVIVSTPVYPINLKNANIFYNLYFRQLNKMLLFTAWEAVNSNASGPFKVACGEDPDARKGYFTGSDAGQRRARPREK